MFKNVSIIQVVSILAGALVLNKILKSKIAVVAKNNVGNSVVPVLPIFPDVQSTFDILTRSIDLPTNIESELRTPFNSDIKDRVEIASALVANKSTLDYFAN